VYDEQVLAETTQLLTINPEFYTVWNYRRDIIVEHYSKTSSVEALVKLFEKELMFTLQKMKEFPKVYWLWNHRVWLLKNHPTQANWQFELGIVEKLLTADSRNFHGWHYRRFIIEQLELAMGEGQSLALKEFEYTTSMINKDFSNFSAWHNRSKLIPILFELKPTELFNDKLVFLQNELKILQNAMYTDPEDQSFWVYLRWLLTSDQFVKALDTETYLSILRQQLQVVKDLNELEKDDNDGIDNTWCLKTIVQIEQIISKTAASTGNSESSDEFTDEIRESLKTLARVDPLRKNLYEEQITSI
jgi:geranylgeranyl transferase type-2 subunit alpha